MSVSLQDPRGYLQKRVALFTGLSSLLFVVLLVVDLMNSAEGELFYSSSRRASFAMSAAGGAVWAYTRKGNRSMVACRALDLLMMATSIAVFATLPLFPPVPGAGGAMALFTPTVMAIIVLLRAAIIPSPAWLSVVVCLTWGAVMTVSSVLGWEGIIIFIPGQPEASPLVFPIVNGAFATVTIAFVAGVVSHVVYGLQTQVREAMQLGRYTLESKIGEGGMGAVYRARHQMLRRPTAVKLLPPEKSGEQAIARFEREVQQTSRLTHPNTVSIFDYGRTDDGVFYYAMEYLDGISLQDLVETYGPLPQARVVHVILQVADALAEAHDVGLVHRDIKPDNIVLCERGGATDVVKVVDFGLVKDIEAPDDVQLSTADVIRGTPLYLAPESVTGPESVDGRTDLYALGAVAYFLLVGEPIFSGKVVEVLGHHLHTTPETPTARGAEVDADLEAVVMRCLQKAPGDRYASARELADALNGCESAGRWTRAEAREWWDLEREKITARLERREEPANVTVAPA